MSNSYSEKNLNKKMDRDLFEKSLIWAEDLIKSGSVEDEFVTTLVQQLRRRFNEGSDCRGCYKQMNFLVERLETGSFPWEKDINRIKLDISSLQNQLKKIKDKND